MSILVEDPTTPLIAGAILVREVDGLGVRGDQLPAAGPGFESYLQACADLPADNAVEFRGEMVSHTFPSGYFEYYDDGSTRVLAGCQDGIYTYTFRLISDGAAAPTPITNTVVVGASGGLTITAQIEAFAANLQMITPVAGSLSVNASIDQFQSALFFLGAQTGTLPRVLSKARQYTVNPDEHLDTYAIQNQFALLWEKDPDAFLDYSINWSDWLAEIPGDSVANMYVNNTAGVQVPVQGIIDGAITAVMARAGVVGATEEIVIRIATTEGRIDERTIRLLIRQR
jgi:hypothetical protein